MSQLARNITGATTFPGKPIFSAYLSAQVLNATGDGTIFDVIPDTIIENRTSSYNNITGVFTAPFSGTYTFIFQVDLRNVGAGHTDGFLTLVTSIRSFFLSRGSYAAMRTGGGILAISTVCNAFLNASDTASLDLNVQNSTKTVTVFGTNDGNFRTFFQAFFLG